MLLEGQCWPTIFPNKALEPAAMEVVWVALLGGCVGQPCPLTGLWCHCPGKLCGPPAWGLCGPTTSPCMVQGQATTHHQEVLSWNSGPLFWCHRCAGCIGAGLAKGAMCRNRTQSRSPPLKLRAPFLVPLLCMVANRCSKVLANIGQTTMYTITNPQWHGQALCPKFQPP